ncbi:glycosyltransferase [Candidatus Pelagibacter sp.]|nr:glycosyltransferase [Candidatus Pelagibacter sp.]
MLNTKKKLIIFNPSIEDGGVEKNLFIISNYLVKYYKEIQIISSNPEKKSKFNKRIIFTYPKNKFWHNKSRYYKYFICLFLLFKEIVKGNKILVFSFQANIYCIFLCKLFNVKIIVRSNTSPKGWTNNFIKNLIFNYYFKRADHIIANSYDFKKQLEKKFKIKVSCIYNPLNIETITKLSKIKIKINFFKPKKKYLKIINIGRLTDQKDHLTLIRAIDLIKNDLPVKLIIIGKGINKKKINLEIKKRKLGNVIKLLGYKKNPYNYIKNSDLFILSSKFEGLPNVLMETMVLKKFIISSDCPTGPSEILEDGKLGYLFKVSNHVQLAQRIKKYIKEKNKLKKIINNAHLSLEKFNFERNCFKYYKIINKYIND